MKNKKENNNLDLQTLLTERQEESINTATAGELVSLIAMNELTNRDKIKLTSRIKEEQVLILTKLNLFSEIFDIDFVKSLANNILELQVSIKGLGRKELVRVVNSSIPDEIVKRGMFDRKDPFR
jgi:hypothetical protein